MRLPFIYLSFFSLVLTLSFFGCSSTEDNLDLAAGEDCTLAAVASDYSSSSVSLLDSQGRVCFADYLNSGSAVPGLVTAFSGDLVMPSTPHPQGFLTLIDRYPNSVVSLVDVEEGVIRNQFSVGPGFAANPQDIFFLSSERAYVSRHEANPSPTDEAADFDEGDDILIVDPESGEALGRIPLAEYAPPSESGGLFPARPGRMTLIGDYIWTALRALSLDFQKGGEGVLVGIDPELDEVGQTLQLPGARNCGSLKAWASGDGAWGVCTGVFYDGKDRQVADSEIFRLSVVDGALALSHRIEAEELQNRPLGFSLAVLDSDRVVYLVLGDLDLGEDDALHLYDRRDGESVDLGIRAGAYEIGSVSWLDTMGILLVSKADPVNPGLVRMMFEEDGSTSLMDEIDISPGIGLPPRQVGAFR